MSGSPAATQPHRPDPALTATAGPKTTGFPLGLVRRFIDYGKRLTATLRPPPPGKTRRSFPHHIGILDIRLILDRVACGLQRAAALEVRLLQRAQQEKRPPPLISPYPRLLPPTPPAIRRAATTDPALARLPTVAEIAEQVRRRPIGAIFADICHDFGIMPDHPLWDDISRAVLANGGKFTALVKRLLKPPHVWIDQPFLPALSAWPATPPLITSFATGPP